MQFDWHEVGVKTWNFAHSLLYFWCYHTDGSKRRHDAHVLCYRLPLPALDLLDKMLELDPARRISAKAALDCAWLRNTTPSAVFSQEWVSLLSLQLLDACSCCDTDSVCTLAIDGDVISFVEWYCLYRSSIWPSVWYSKCIIFILPGSTVRATITLHYFRKKSLSCVAQNCIDADVLTVIKGKWPSNPLIFGLRCMSLGAMLETIRSSVWTPRKTVTSWRMSCSQSGRNCLSIQYNKASWASWRDSERASKMVADTLNMLWI